MAQNLVFFYALTIFLSQLLVAASSLCISDEDCPEALPLMFVKCVCGACEYYTQIQDEK
ncbi:putative Late nodulin [Medicago truncatula]|uniref:Nodule Cysteine-Rich (NCR) secreted peptide n=1 Tax=Medicago truncatula TaxID=3880 RepID=A0A072VEF3_MEDTR|nr:Nodule Cysteine-Rich (NCR) secreted peptide [Medicago truncatula]RHN77776.1 putative Late nodulin [Medicago truncatula]